MHRTHWSLDHRSRGPIERRTTGGLRRARSEGTAPQGITTSTVAPSLRSLSWHEGGCVRDLQAGPFGVTRARHSGQMAPVHPSPWSNMVVNRRGREYSARAQSVREIVPLEARNGLSPFALKQRYESQTKTWRRHLVSLRVLRSGRVRRRSLASRLGTRTRSRSCVRPCPGASGSWPRRTPKSGSIAGQIPRVSGGVSWASIRRRSDAIEFPAPSLSRSRTVLPQSCQRIASWPVS